MKIANLIKPIIFTSYFGILTSIFYLFYFQRGISEAGGLVNKIQEFGININLLFLAILAILFIAGTLLIKYYNYIVYKLEDFKFDKVVILIAVIFSVIFSIVAINKHYNFQTGLFDFGLEHQVIWNTSQGRLLDASVEVGNYLGDHFSPLTIVPGVLYNLYPKAEFVFIFAVLCVGLAALGIYAISKKILHPMPQLFSFVVFIIFFLYMGISGLMLTDYHPVVMALPLLVWGVYFYEFKKVRTGILLLILACFAKEDIGVFVGMYGLYNFIFKKDKKGLLLALFGFAIAIVALFVLIPFFRGVASDTLARYSQWGNSGGEIVKGILLNPLQVLGHILRKDQITYFIRLFFPLGFIALLSPKRLFIILPSFGINILTNFEGQLSTLNHYDVMTSVGIFLAFIEGIKYLNMKDLLKPVLVSIILVNVLLLSGHPVWRGVFTDDNRSEVSFFLNEIKPTLKPEYIVAATNTVGAHLGDRQNLQIFDEGWINYNQEPDIVILDNYSTNERIQAQWDLLISSGEYEGQNISPNIKIAVKL